MPGATNAPLDTTATTNRTTTGALGAVVVGVAGFLYSAYRKDPNAVKEVETAVSGLTASSGVLGGIWSWVRAAEAEAEHDMTRIEAEASQITGVPSSTISAEVSRQLQQLTIGKTQSLG
jgi:hypothetical protein